MRLNFLLDDWPVTIKVWRDYKVNFDSHVSFLYRQHEENGHKDFWKWLPARIQTISEMVDEPNRINTLGAVMEDVASHLKAHGQEAEAMRTALAACFLQKSPRIRPLAGKIIRTILAEGSPDVAAAVRAQMNDLCRQQSFGYKIARLFNRLICALCWNRETRQKIRRRYP